MSANNKFKPIALKDIKNFHQKIKDKEPFCFVRYSDGETEIIRNRYLKISKGKTHFKGKIFNNNFSDIDTKEFDPNSNRDLREDLLISAIKKMPNYFKGMPHKRFKKDRELMITLHGGLDQNITFADLLINSNYIFFRKNIVPEFANYKHIYLIANYRAIPKNILEKSKHLMVPDNFFSNYQNVKNDILNNLFHIPSGSLILSSASSLSNIIGFELFKQRNDITFLDIGTSINDLIGLQEITRTYHEIYFSKGIIPFFKRLRPSFRIRW